ncbi:hypothetical protein GH714_035358 [Hevea brasiliensis]|uniref:Uncharacterized protein n=1 Tax=Hevea brasiliensis TaxID=3981 RepID=A0A6A6M337_HEVBR|nr:hypothetical protein GH714_035358 [Hevea brasiliensis]
MGRETTSSITNLGLIRENDRIGKGIDKLLCKRGGSTSKGASRGPGCSSVGAEAFYEHGLFRPSGGENLIINEYSWNKAQDNLIFLRQWFVNFPEYKNIDFFNTGESYTGHYVPQLAKLIVESGLNFSLKGIAIGNPLLEYNTDLNSEGDYYWSHTFISDAAYELIRKVCKKLFMPSLLESAIGASAAIVNYDGQNLEIPNIDVMGSLVSLGIRVLVYSRDQDSVTPFLGTRILVSTATYRPCLKINRLVDGHKYMDRS